MAKILKAHHYCIFCFLLLFSYKQSVAGVIDTAVVVAGTSTITGKITRASVADKDDVSVNITVSLPISGEFVKYKGAVDRSGKFSIHVDVETDISLVDLSVSLNPEKYFLVKLTNGGTTNIEIAYNSNFDIENIDVTPAMHQNDMIRGFEVMNKMIGYRSGRAQETLYNKDSGHFLNYAKTILSERLAIVKSDTSISEELKAVLADDFRLFLYISHVFDYEKYMIFNYKNTNGDKNKKPVIEKIDKIYFRFLKDFDLNNPRYLNCLTFQEFQKKFFKTKY